LIKAKDQLGHGEWLPWLGDHCQVPERTAQLYMRLARHAPELERKSATVADLSLREAAGLLTEHRVIVERPIEHCEVRPVKVEVTTEHREIRAVGYVIKPAQPVAWDGQADRQARFEVETIMRYIRQLASSKEKYAGAGALTVIVDHMSAAQQAEVVKQLADIQSLAVLLSEAIRQAAAVRSGGNVLTFRQQDPPDEPDPAA
jgi:hypothetical protein